MPITEPHRRFGGRYARSGRPSDSARTFCASRPSLCCAPNFAADRWRRRRRPRTRRGGPAPAAPVSPGRNRARPAAPRAPSRCSAGPVRPSRARHRRTPAAVRCSAPPAAGDLLAGESVWRHGAVAGVKHHARLIQAAPRRAHARVWYWTSARSPGKYRSTRVSGHVRRRSPQLLTAAAPPPTTITDEAAARRSCARRKWASISSAD